MTRLTRLVFFFFAFGCVLLEGGRGKKIRRGKRVSFFFRLLLLFVSKNSKNGAKMMENEKVKGKNIYSRDAAVVARGHRGRRHRRDRHGDGCFLCLGREKKRKRKKEVRFSSSFLLSQTTIALRKKKKRKDPKTYLPPWSSSPRTRPRTQRRRRTAAGPGSSAWPRSRRR